MKNKTSKKYSKSVSDFDFHLPQSRIAQKPVTPRDRSKLLIINKKCDQDSQDYRINHDRFFNLDKYLEKGNVLVLNDTKVIPARLHGRKETGGKVEIFLLQEIAPGLSARGARVNKSAASAEARGYRWNCMIGGKVKPGIKINLKNNFTGTVLVRNNDDTWQVEFNKKNITSIGETPTPPYIKKKAKLERYQTIYAKDPGSVAAPTAGLHFTPRVFKKLKAKGVEVVYVTLHVGLGTFAPIRVDKLEDIKLHKEYYSVDKEVIKKINKAKKENRRIISVGTTSTRTLESLPHKGGKIVEKNYDNLSTNIFISPGYKFKVIDGMITNFHLPKSSLIMLVAAFYNLPGIKQAYQEAIDKKYRFYSFGDAMFIY